MSLYADYFETDTYDLREDLGLTTADMAKYFKEIGARVTNMSETERSRKQYTKAEASMHKIARLKLPLEFPKQRLVPRGRR